MTSTGPALDHPPSAASLVRSIHGASLSAARWPAVLEQLRRYLDARVATLGHHEFSTGLETALCSPSDDAGFGSAMAAFAPRNPWFLSSEDYVAGRVMTGDELISNQDLRRTDFYRRVLQPRGLLHWLCGVVTQCGQRAHLLSVFRAEEQAAFDGRDRAELAVMLEHVTLSLESHWRWQECDDLARALLALNDDNHHPAILVTGDGEIVYRNREADRLLGEGSGMRMDGRLLVASSAGDQRLLRETIARLARGECAGAAPSVLTLAAMPPGPPVVAVLRAAGPVFSRQAGTHRGLVMIEVRGGATPHDPTTCVFASQYELTAAQSKVSALVFGGQSLVTIAQSLHLSENTVRSHLKQIFQKTGTHGQMELVHLHARMCRALR